MLICIFEQNETHLLDLIKGITILLKDRRLMCITKNSVIIIRVI